MRKLLFVFLFLLTTVFFSCKTFTVQKRLYNKGVYISCNNIFDKILYSNNISSRHKETKIFASNDSNLIKTIFDNKFTESLSHIITPVDTPPKNKKTEKHFVDFDPKTYLEPKTYDEYDCFGYGQARFYYSEQIRKNKNVTEYDSISDQKKLEHFDKKCKKCERRKNFGGLISLIPSILIGLAIFTWGILWTIKNGFGWPTTLIIVLFLGLIFFAIFLYVILPTYSAG